MLDAEARARYARHLSLEGFGESAQRRLLDSSVLLIGLGGLGCPATIYLAAAGVGRLGLIDDDVVDRSNLQRQVIHRERDVGLAKVDSAARAIRDLNSSVAVDAHRERLHAGNAEALFGDYDVVIDGADNFPTRYVAADAAHLTGTPLVHGSIFHFEGRLTVFAPGRGPCYRCLYPEPPPPGSVPSCAEAGVLGVLPGTVGLGQATEAIKVLAGIGDPLIGRLLLYDALSMEQRILAFDADPSCPLCGERPTITRVEELDWACETGPGGIERWGAERLAAALDTAEEIVLVDVRESDEVAAGAIPGHRHVPLGELATRLEELRQHGDRLIVCQCQRGGRSLKAAELLRAEGFPRVANLEGGYLAWLAREREEHT